MLRRNKESHGGKEPFLRIVRITEENETRGILLRILAIVAALVAGGIFLSALGHQPLQVYLAMWNGSFGSAMSAQGTIKIAIPLVINALAVTLAFKMKFWNIGTEGQMIVGAVAASYFALFHSHWPHFVLIGVMALAGIVAGGLYGLIPAYFKARFSTNETLLTLMANYIALYIVQFLREGLWKDPGAKGFPQIARFAANARLSLPLGVHFGWVIALLLIPAVYIYMRFTKQGYEIAVVGESEKTATYAGMNVRKIIMRTMFLSGGIAGLAGMLQASGADRTLTDTVAGGVGFTAIIVAWLANLSSPVILLVSLVFAILEKGGGYIQSMFQISASAADLLQGIILFFVLGFEFFIRYRVVIRNRGV